MDSFIKSRVILFVWPLVLLMSTVFCSTTVLGVSNGVVEIIYANVPQPYEAVFNAIISGIEKGSKLSINRRLVEDEGDFRELAVLDDSKRRVLVALGSKGLEACQYTEPGVTLLVGAIVAPPRTNCGSLGGVVLAPDPKHIFSRLTSLSADVRTVHVVYNPDVNDWLMQFAAAAAEEQKLQLKHIPVGNLQEAVQQYRKLIDSGLGRGDAIWLPQDSYTVDDGNVLPLLLKASWDQGFIVFSSNPAHVKRGVLFSLYPDYQAMGTRLGEMAAAVIRRPDVKNLTLEPLRDVLIAVNLRTADHLRLNLSNRQISNFDLTFPASR